VLRYLRGQPASHPRPALFLDRDGVLNQRRVDGYVVEPQDFEPLEIALEAALAAQKLGAAVVVVTNQGCIGRGRATESQVMAVHDVMLSWLGKHGIALDGIFTCPHHPLSDDPAQRECRCRKPKPGLILAATAELNLDLSSSILIGDQPSDIGAALAAGIAAERTLLVDTSRPSDLATSVRRVWAPAA
jgi:D-glycero-D-manno-heptose 1,7-bisphosphate phosphatase